MREATSPQIIRGAMGADSSIRRLANAVARAGRALAHSRYPETAVTSGDALPSLGRFPRDGAPSHRAQTVLDSLLATKECPSYVDSSVHAV